MRTRKQYPTSDTVRELFALSADQRLYWRIRPSMGVRAGTLAGHIRKNNSTVIIIRRKAFMANRLIQIYRGEA
jgi:hypothetical protein